jgi:anti-sigma factor (TIGR02949 family)
MNRVPFGEGGCEKARRYLDSYISNELLVETNHEMLRHLDGCPACTAEADARTRLRARLKTAVEAQSVPPELQARVRESIRARASRRWLGAGWTGWALASAAGLAVAMGVWTTLPLKLPLPSTDDRPAQNVYIQKVSERVAAVLKVGLGDHIHCAVFRKYPRNPPGAEQMEKDLGPEYKGLMQVVKAAVPANYRLVMAHQCSYARRKYVHLTLQNGQNLISLVIARKDEGETMRGLRAAASPSGIPVYQSPAERYEVAGFETDRYLAFVVSDLSAGKNLQVAVELARGVREFLIGA